MRFQGETKFENIIHFKRMRLREYDGGIALENYDGNGLFISTSGNVYIDKGGNRYEVDVK